MLFTTKWLATIFTNNKGYVTDQVAIDVVVTDSRLKTSHALFIPIVGEQFDGHQFVEQAIENGAVSLIWQKDQPLPSSIPTDFPVFYVEDTLTALQQLASTYRDSINPVVIGITGSNGKTTTKDLVTSVLKTTYTVHATKGNFNNHIGLPLTVLSMPRGTEVLVLEMGMNNFNEIDLLSKLAKPDYAIITNIGESHLEFLGSREGIAKAKLEILNSMDTKSLLIVDGDEALLSTVSTHDYLQTCGYGSKCDVVIESVMIKHDATTFQLNGSVHYSVPLLGRHHAKNATYAIMLGKALNITEENIQQGLTNTISSGMRFEMMQGMNGVSIINDAYNASPTSMIAAIEVVKEMSGFEEKILILGDMFELGEQTKELHASVADCIDKQITAVYTYGTVSKVIIEKLKDQGNIALCQHLDSKEELIDILQQHVKRNSLLLFKASRGMEFEALIDRFKVKQ